MSSTCSAMLGYQSDTQIPLWPCCFHARLDGMSVLPPVPIAVIGLPKDEGNGCPASFSNAGFGSNRSMWLGPPSINNQITDLALGAKCGAFGANGSVSDAALLSPSSEENASAPSPLPVFQRNSRRDRLLMSASSIAVNELIGVQQRLAEIHQGRRLQSVDCGCHVRR